MGILDLFSLRGKVALVTGAAQGLGQGMALALAEAGAEIAALDRKPPDETRLKVEALGRRCLPLTCDLRLAPVTELGEVVEQVVGALGRLDILVNNAGIIRRAAALDFSEADWDDVIQVNQRAVFFLSQAAARCMVQQGGGRIINVASMLSFQGGIRVPSYTAAKSAVAGLTRALANEWAAQKVNVNAIAPGYMATENTSALRADQQRAQAILERIPAGRWGEPADLQGAVVYLASPASNYVTGSILCVDGGWMAR
jgi:2-dehydro-3-deoxy-D-gluconate 5-dehydrogenase